MAQAIIEADQIDQEEVEESKAPQKLSRTYTRKKDRPDIELDAVAF